MDKDEKHANTQRKAAILKTCKITMSLEGERDGGTFCVELLGVKGGG